MGQRMRRREGAGDSDAERNINKYKENKCMPQPETLKVYEMRVAAKVSLFFQHFFFFLPLAFLCVAFAPLAAT